MFIIYAYISSKIKPLLLPAFILIASAFTGYWAVDRHFSKKFEATLEAKVAQLETEHKARIAKIMFDKAEEESIINRSFEDSKTAIYSMAESTCDVGPRTKAAIQILQEQLK